MFRKIIPLDSEGTVTVGPVTFRIKRVSPSKVDLAVEAPREMVIDIGSTPAPVITAPLPNS